MNWNSASNTEIINELGDRIRQQRIKRKLTQQQLAEISGVSLFTVAQMEKGKSISLSMFIPILRALRLLENLELLFPENQISPIALLKKGNITEKRVRNKKN